MDITYLGHSSFKIKGRQASIVTDPYDSQMVGIKFSKIDADIVTISHHHADHDRADGVSAVKKVVDGPGEYEISGVSIIGLPSFHDNKKGADRGKNTIYVIEMDNLRLLHLGDLGHTLNENQIKEIGDIDILFVPVGGFYTLGPKEAVEVLKQIGPSIVIPMHYKMQGVDSQLSQKLSPVEDFLTLSGLRVEKLPKLNIKEGDLGGDEEYAVVLEKK